MVLVWCSCEPLTASVEFSEILPAATLVIFVPLVPPSVICERSELSYWIEFATSPAVSPIASATLAYVLPLTVKPPPMVPVAGL